MYAYITGILVDGRDTICMKCNPLLPPLLGSHEEEYGAFYWIGFGLFRIRGRRNEMHHAIRKYRR